MAELKVGDRVIRLDVKSPISGVVTKLGTPDSFGVHESTARPSRNVSVVSVDWGELTSSGDPVFSLHWATTLAVLPSSREPEVIERWLA